jgi:hypothetical protein
VSEHTNEAVCRTRGHTHIHGGETRDVLGIGILLPLELCKAKDIEVDFVRLLWSLCMHIDSLEPSVVVVVERIACVATC